MLRSEKAYRLVRSVPIFITVLFFLWGCKDKEDPIPQSNEYLITAEKIGELSRQEITDIAGSVSPILAALVKNDIALYRVIYRTTHVDGRSIEASGAVAIPLGDSDFPMLSVQHGTIVDEASAPSNFTPGKEFMQYGSVFGALGYIAVFPDYIGYGASKHLPHPYEHRESLGSASLDMLRAVKEFLRGDGVAKWNNKLYISGFSEGGYATLSLQKMLEEKAKGEFDLRASTCGAGAYNKTQFMNYIINNETHGNVGYNRSYLWVLLSYNSIYNLNYPLSHFFKEPYAAQIEKEQLLTPLTASFHTYFRPEFVSGVNDGTEKGFIAAVADNDLLDWKPITPTQLYHGTDDELVFYFNSETAYEAMKAKGATQVELKILEGKNHSTAVMDYLIGTYSFFNSKP